MKTNHVLLFCLILVSLKRVPAESRKCFITEIKHSSQNGFLNKTHIDQECQDMKFPLDIPLPENGTINCFKITGTDSRGAQMDIKGCIEAGKCEEIKKLNSSRFPADAKCFECETDSCNFASKIENFSVAVSVFIISLSILFH